MWLASSFAQQAVVAQNENTELFRVGERLTYNISFGRFQDVAFAETQVVSRGKVSGKDAVEIQSRLKTLNFVVMDFLLVDILRTAFVSPTDGTPIYVKDTDSSNGAPIETVTSFAEKGGGIFELSSVIYKIRASPGTGAFEILENDRRYGVTFNIIGTETVTSAAGEFPANIIDVQSPFLTEKGITGLKISLAAEGSKVPVQFRAKTVKGEFRALIASIQVATPDATPTPTPVVTQTPRPTPKPSATPSYVDNQPLVGLPFELGEKLDFRVTSAGRNIGTVSLTAAERKMVSGRDSLLLRAQVTAAATGEIFRVGNGIRSYVDPETLAPIDIELKFDGPLSGFNQTARFDKTGSKVSVNGANVVDVPIGTHSILSLIYAMRQFNLQQSKDVGNPVNDTRVAVFWQGKANIFVLRPDRLQTITIGERKLPANKISVNTGVPQLDSLRITLWLGEDEKRTPLRLTIGTYQLDLIIREDAVLP